MPLAKNSVPSNSEHLATSKVGFNAIFFFQIDRQLQYIDIVEIVNTLIRSVNCSQ